MAHDTTTPPKRIFVGIRGVNLARADIGDHEYVLASEVAALIAEAEARADEAEAALAAVVERAAEVPLTEAFFCLPGSPQDQTLTAVARAIRALAPASGLAKLAELLAERDALLAEGAALSAGQCLFTDGSGLVGDEYGNSVCQMRFRAEAAEAERDTLAALAAPTSKMTDLTDFVRWACDAPSLHQVQQRAHKLLEKKDD